MKEQYDKLLASGMFFELHPDLSGNWEIDKPAFIKWMRSVKRKKKND